MGLNDIQLSGSQVIDLYSRHLVAGSENEALTPRAAAKPLSESPAMPGKAPADTTAVQPAAQTAGPKPLQWLGKNQKKINILVNYPKEVYLPESDLNFLTSILQACRLNLGDVAIVNYAHHPLQPAALRGQLPAEYLLAFGVAVTEPALQSLAPFTPLQQNGCTIVLAPPLDQLNNNNPEGRPLKTKLWNCLKQLFNV